MIIAMPDSITAANLPAGYPAYLAYVDGRWPTASAVRAAHPGAEILTLTVLGGGEKADGCDRENGDLTAASAAEWLHLAIIAGQWRPVLYASRDNVPAVLDELSNVHVAREQIRILSAHYGAGQHICSPSACGAKFTADGTQWTDAFPGVGGAAIDMSVLADDFFGATAPQPTVEVDVKLQALRQGDSGQQVRNWQGLLVSHGYGYLLGPGSGGSVESNAGVDGAFGAKTAAATRRFQADRHMAQTGEVGAAEWTAALG